MPSAQRIFSFSAAACISTALTALTALPATAAEAFGQTMAENVGQDSQTSSLPEQQASYSSDRLAALFKVGDTSGLSGMLAFTAKIGNQDRLLVLDLDAARIRKIIDGPGNNSYPAFKPDGTKLAFTSDRDGNKEIYLADWDGSNQQRLTNNKVNDDNASWSPNGRWIVYYSETGKGSEEANVFVIDAENPLPLQITRFKGRNTTPRFDIEKKRIVYSTNRFWPGWDICSWDLLEKKEKCLLSGAQTYCRPRFSPNGLFLAYSAGAFNEVDIDVLNLKSNEKKNLTNLPGKEYDASWSGDGKYIAFTAENGRRDVFNVFVQALDNPKSLRPLITSDISIRFLDWSPVKTLNLEAQRIREAQDKEALQSHPGASPLLPSAESVSTESASNFSPAVSAPLSSTPFEPSLDSMFD